MHASRTTHFAVVKRILRYLKGTASYGLMLRKGTSLSLTGYSDADWAGSPDDRRSTSGYCVFLGPTLISWSAKKQSYVSRSNSEAEYRSLASLAADIIWIRYLLRDIGISCPDPPRLHQIPFKKRKKFHTYPHPLTWSYLPISIPHTP